MPVASQSPVDLVAEIPMRSCAICHCQDLWLFMICGCRKFHDLPPSKSVGAVILHDVPLSRSVGAGHESAQSVGAAFSICLRQFASMIPASAFTKAVRREHNLTDTHGLGGGAALPPYLDIASTVTNR